jgi:hypothetical protein
MMLNKVLNKIRSGRMAQAGGASWESMFEIKCKMQRFECTRVPDGCRQLGPKKIVRVVSPWDYVISSPAGVALLDTKVCQNNFPHSGIVDHQVDEMVKHRRNGVEAGYIIWMRLADTVLYARADLLATWRKTKGSVHPDNCVFLGTYESMDLRKIFDIQEDRREEQHGMP